MKPKVVTMKPEVLAPAKAPVVLKAPLTPLQAKRKLRAQRRLKRRS